jgi:hypothetical protein
MRQPAGAYSRAGLATLFSKNSRQFGREVPLGLCALKLKRVAHAGRSSKSFVLITHLIVRDQRVLLH